MAAFVNYLTRDRETMGYGINNILPFYLIQRLSYDPTYSKLISIGQEISDRTKSLYINLTDFEEVLRSGNLSKYATILGYGYPELQNKLNSINEISIYLNNKYPEIKLYHSNLISLNSSDSIALIIQWLSKIQSQSKSNTSGYREENLPVYTIYQTDNFNPCLFAIYCIPCAGITGASAGLLTAVCVLAADQAAHSISVTKVVQGGPGGVVTTKTVSCFGIVNRPNLTNVFQSSTRKVNNLPGYIF